jgi:phosphoribosyl 1,2-cyclic phosphodiesterase
MDNHLFQTTFRGVRGSIPTPLTTPQIEEKLAIALQYARPGDLRDDESRKAFIASLPIEVRGCFGGNSSCVHVEVGGHHLIFDAGTGIRGLGLDLMKKEFGRGQGKAHLFFSHTHWDHISGLPFFVPFYVKGNRFTINSPEPDIRGRLKGQQVEPYFPVPFEAYSATLIFPDHAGKTSVTIGDVKISWKEMYHPNASHAYRVDYAGRSFIYATDAEYKSLTREELQPSVDFFRDADLLVFDAQYTFGEGLEKSDWGHSSTFIGVDLAVDAGVKSIAFYHHEPTYSDFKLVEILKQTQVYLKPLAPKSNLKMFLAQEGLTVDLMDS